MCAKCIGESGVGKVNSVGGAVDPTCQWSAAGQAATGVIDLEGGRPLIAQCCLLGTALSIAQSLFDPDLWGKGESFDLSPFSSPPLPFAGRAQVPDLFMGLFQAWAGSGE